jgi:hypothetical protein
MKNVVFLLYPLFIQRELYGVTVWLLQKVFNMKKYLFSLLLVSVIACKKGETGPAGIQGPVGSANVIYSDWLSLDLKAGVYAGVYYNKITTSKVTQAVVDQGDVRMYFKSFTGILPVPSAMLPGLYYSFSLGAIEVFSPTKWDISSGYKYRYIIIPGAEPSGNGRTSGLIAGYTREELKSMSYEKIAAIFNIPETGSNEKP